MKNAHSKSCSLHCFLKLGLKNVNAVHTSKFFPVLETMESFVSSKYQIAFVYKDQCIILWRLLNYDVSEKSTIKENATRLFDAILTQTSSLN